MSITLQKGQKVDLTKGGVAGGAGLSRLMVGLGWDEAPSSSGGGFFSALLGGGSHEDIDCDTSAIMLGANGKILSTTLNETCVFYNNLSMFGGAVKHQGDNLTGAGDGDDEQIMVDLSRIPAYVERIVFVVNIYKARDRHQHFGMIRNAFIRLVDLSSNSELCKFNLSEGYDNMTGLIAGEIYRKNGAWKFNAIGQGVPNASLVSDLVSLYA